MSLTWPTAVSMFSRLALILGSNDLHPLEAASSVKWLAETLRYSFVSFTGRGISQVYHGFQEYLQHTIYRGCQKHS
jgi:hypothetical protein